MEGDLIVRPISPGYLALEGEARLHFHIIIWLHVLTGLILPYPSDSMKRWKRLQPSRGLSCLSFDKDDTKVCSD